MKYTVKYSFDTETGKMTDYELTEEQQISACCDLLLRPRTTSDMPDEIDGLQCLVLEKSGSYDVVDYWHLEELREHYVWWAELPEKEAQ